MQYKVHPGLMGAALLSTVSMVSAERDGRTYVSAPLDLVARCEGADTAPGHAGFSRTVTLRPKFGLTQEGKNKHLLRHLLFNRPMVPAGEQLTEDPPQVSGCGVAFALTEKGKMNDKIVMPRAYLQQTILTSGWASYKGDADDKHKATKSPLIVAIVNGAMAKLAMKTQLADGELVLKREIDEGDWNTRVIEHTDNAIGWGYWFRRSDLNRIDHKAPQGPDESMSNGYMWEDPAAGVLAIRPAHDRELTGNTFPRDSSNRGVERDVHRGKFTLESNRVYNVIHDSLNGQSDPKHSCVGGVAVEVSSTSDTTLTQTQLQVNLKAQAFTGLAHHAIRLIWRDFFLSYLIDNEVEDYGSIEGGRTVKELWFNTGDVTFAELQLVKDKLWTGSCAVCCGLYGASSASLVPMASAGRGQSNVASAGSFYMALDDSFATNFYKNGYSQKGVLRGWERAVVANLAGFSIEDSTRACPLLGGNGKDRWAEKATGVIVGAPAAWVGVSGYHSELDGIVYRPNGSPLITQEGAVLTEMTGIAPGWELLVGEAFGVWSNTIGGLFQNGIEDDPWSWDSFATRKWEQHLTWFFASVPGDYLEEAS